MATGFVQPLALTRILGQEGYGLYGVVLSAISIVNNVVVSGSIQAMSRAVIQGGDRALRRGLLLHVALGAFLASMLVLNADTLGATLLRDPAVPGLLRVAAIVVADYSVYAALVGAFNGRRRYGVQAALDITFSTLRTLLIVGLSWWGFGAPGAVLGFAIASGMILLLALGLTVPNLRGVPSDLGVEPMPERLGTFAQAYSRYFAPVLAYQLALNLVLQGDTLLFKALAARAGHGVTTVNTFLGVYKAAQNFAFLPYQLLLSVTFVLFPVVSRATLEGDRATTERFVRGALRFSALALGAMLPVLAGCSRKVLQLAYPSSFEAGAVVLRNLALGQGAFTLLVVCTTIVLAAGRTRAATSLMGFTVAAVAMGDVVGLLLAGDPLQGVSLGTAVGQGLGLLVTAGYVRREFGVFLGGKTVLRVVGAAGVATLAARALPFEGKMATLLGASITVGIYLALLWFSGELNLEDFNRFRRVARKG
jgi:stage V sporulation protein B